MLPRLPFLLHAVNILTLFKIEVAAMLELAHKDQSANRHSGSSLGKIIALISALAAGGLMIYFSFSSNQTTVQDGGIKSKIENVINITGDMFSGQKASPESREASNLSREANGRSTPAGSIKLAVIKPNVVTKVDGINLSMANFGNHFNGLPMASFFVNGTDTSYFKVGQRIGVKKRDGSYCSFMIHKINGEKGRPTTQSAEIEDQCEE